MAMRGIRGWVLGTAFGAGLLLAAPAARGQGLSRFQLGGRAIASQFAWRAEAEVSAAKGGQGTIRFDTAWLTLRDGSAYEPWAAGVPVAIEDGAASETVVLLSSTCTIGGAGPCQATANFANAHAGRMTVRSADDGLQEAIDYLGTKGGQVILTSDWNGTLALPGLTGTAQVQIVDQRKGGETWYDWNGSAYAPAASVGIAEQGLAAPAIEGVRYADQWCAVAGQLDQSCLADAAQGFSGELVIPTGHYEIGADLVLPAGIRYVFAAGAELVVPPPFTVTVDGEISAGNYQIFSLTSPVIVSDAAMTSGSATLTSAASSFTPAEVGSKVYVSGAGGAEAFGAHLPATGILTAVSSATEAVASFSNESGGDLSAATAIYGGSYISFGTRATPALNPVWWGADPAETRDSTAAFNEAFTAGGDANIPVVIPTGNYLVGNLQGGDPMQWQNYSAYAQVGDAAVIRGQGRNFDQVTLHAEPGTTGYVLTRKNFAGGSWSGFSIDGGGEAACFDAEWVLPSGAPGPSTQDVFRNLAGLNCAGHAFDLDNQNDATIHGLEATSTDLSTTAGTPVAAGSTAAVTPASMQGIFAGKVVLVGSGSQQEAVAVAATTSSSFTPAASWQMAHGPESYAITVPGIGVSLLATTGEQSVSDLTINQGILLISVQNGAIQGGFFAQGIELGSASYNTVAAVGAQIWAGPDLGAAVEAVGIGQPQSLGFSCVGCLLRAQTGQSVVQGQFMAGAVFVDCNILDGAGTFFGSMRAQTSNPPVFQLIHSVLAAPPNAVAAAAWTATGSYLGGSGNQALTPFVESSAGAAASAAGPAATPWTVLGAAGQSAPVQTWQVPGSFADEIDGQGDLIVQRAIRANWNDCNTPAAAGTQSLVLSWNYDACQGEGDFWDSFEAAQNASPAFEWWVFDAGGSVHKVAEVDRQGDIIAPRGLAATQLSVNGASPLTGQSGSGTEIVTNMGPAIADAALSGSLTLPSSLQMGAVTLTAPAQSGTLAVSNELPAAGTTGSIGGAALAAGQCGSGTATIPSATDSNVVAVTPEQYPGDGIYWEGYVSSPGTVTVKVCAVVAATPAATAYAVRVLP